MTMNIDNQILIISINKLYHYITNFMVMNTFYIQANSHKLDSKF